MPAKADVLERERRWARPVALITMAAVVLFAASIVVGRSLGGDGDAEVLREVDANTGTFLLAGALTAAGFLVLVAPLLYLFRATQARSPRFRGQLVGVVLAAPLFLAAGALIGSFATLEAASDFVAEPNPGSGDRADELATDLSREASLRPLSAGLLFAGSLGFAIAVAYTCLWAMRTGLLTRFWGSLGMAVGIVGVLFQAFLPFLLLWFIYLGLLIAGWVPGGRPPAWAAGEAVPWPTAGERMAEQMEGSEDAVEAEGREVGAEGEPADQPRERGERRKRKRRE